MDIRISGIIPESIVDGPGFRFVIFTQGCPHHCVGCHNPQTHDFNGGKILKTEDIISQTLENPMIQGITLSGGEPFMQPIPVLEIVKAVKKAGKDVFIYSGFTYEELVQKNEEVRNLLDNCDYLVDGKFIAEKKNLSLLFRGSSNQRIINLKKTRETGVLVEFIPEEDN